MGTEVDKASAEGKQALRNLVAAATEELYNRHGERPVLSTKGLVTVVVGWSRVVEFEEKETGRKFPSTTVEYLKGSRVAAAGGAKSGPPRVCPACSAAPGEACSKRSADLEDWPGYHAERWPKWGAGAAAARLEAME